MMMMMMMILSVIDVVIERLSDRSNSGCQVKPFDWTFTTEYKGTVTGEEFSSLIEESDVKIDLEKLKVKEQILFYDDVCLYEDELGDNGTSMLSVKIRCMPASFFLLMVRELAGSMTDRLTDLYRSCSSAFSCLSLSFASLSISC